MPCHRIPDMRIDHFLDKVVHSPLPVHINHYIEVTYKCNLHCKQCYNPRAKYFDRELTTEEIKRFIELFVESGCIWLNFSGGEPFVRADFMELYSFAKSKGLLIGILTNGTLINKAIARALADDPPLSIDVTVYGASEKTYEALTGLGKGFHQSLTGIDNLLEAGLKPLLQTCVSTINKLDIPGIKQLAQDRQLHHVADPHLHPRIDGDQYPLSLLLTPEEIRDMMISQYTLHPHFNEYLAEYANQPADDRLVKCGMPSEGFWMDPYGRLRMCSIVPYPLYDLRNGGTLQEAGDMFQGYINNYEQSVKTDDAPARDSCRQCDTWFLCQYCVGFSGLVYNRQWDRKFEHFCQTTHLQAQMLKQMGLWPELLHR